MIANTLFLLLGVLLGVAIMALVSINREPDDDDDEDAEMFDFMTRHDLGLSVIKRNGGAAMWGVTTAAPVKMIGTLEHDPRDAISGAMAVMLEKEPARG